VVTLTGNERYDKGLRQLEEVNEKLLARLMDLSEPIAPDLARYVIEFAFGDVYTRPGLDARQRELCIISALTALGGQEQLLKDHIEGAINVGCTKVEVVETIIMMAVYAGFPAAISAIKAAKEVLCE
jgi:4-carboxymuconolactone decarboxylase